MDIVQTFEQAAEGAPAARFGRRRAPRFGLRDAVVARCRRWLVAAQAGQASVEYALIGVIAIVFGMITVQYGLIVFQRYGATYVSRETARWLAVRKDTTDAAVTTQARAVAAGIFGLDTTGMPTVTASPACAALSAGKCAGRDQGSVVTVTVTTDPARVMFLPTTYGVGQWQAQFPTASTTTRTSVMLE